MIREETSSTKERGFELAAARTLGASADAFCARVRPTAGARARKLAEDATLRTAEGRSLGRSVPVGLSQIDPSWYEIPPPSAHPLAAAYCERVAYGHLVDMVGDDLEGAALPQLLVALGKRRVATAFSGAPAAALAQLCARLGDPDASALLSEVRAMPKSVRAEEVRSAQRALLREGPRQGEVGDVGTLFLRIGCGWLAPALSGQGDRLRRLAQRLPRTIGELLLREAPKADGTTTGVPDVLHLFGPLNS